MSKLWHPDIKTDTGPYKVSLHRDDFIDDNRDGRAVPYKLYYPAELAHENLPVILWSHGLGGSRDGAGFLGRYLAGHGYAVMHVTHPGSDTSLWEGKPGHPWDNIRKAHVSRKTMLARFKDIPFVIDRLETENLPARIDTDRIGMSGHSFGALTTQVMAGQKLGKGRRQYSLADPRIQAAVIYSPQPTYNHDQPHEEIYGPINVPALYMTGTKDASPVTGKTYEYRLPVFNHAKGPDQHLAILEDGDHMVFAGSRGQLGENDKRRTHEDIIKLASLAFWESYLKNKTEIRGWLTGGAFRNWLAEHGEHQYRGGPDT